MLPTQIWLPKATLMYHDYRHPSRPRTDLIECFGQDIPLGSDPIS